MAKSHAIANEEAKGYHTDVPYTFHYFNELAPVNINYVARINGYPPIDLNQPFRYLELGCGNAMSLCLNAIANPHAEFIGVDLLPQHVEFATQLAESCGVNNLKIIQCSFEALDLKKLGTFDMMSAHGVISWVSGDVHKSMRHVVENGLKVGGYYYVSYNAMPGWADKAPLQELLSHFISKTVDPTDRLKQGIQLIKFLQENKAGYFIANPNLEREIKHMLTQNPNYLIHEYMNEYWSAFYFREINDFYREANCQYIGNSNFRENYFELVIPKAFHKIIGQLQANNHREFRESLQDFITNNRFRKDVYIKQDKENPIKIGEHQHDNEYYVSFIKSGARKKEIDMQGIKYNLSHEYFDMIHDATAQSAKTFSEIMKVGEKAKVEKAVFMKHLEIFIALNQIIPCTNAVEIKNIQPNYQTIKFGHPIYSTLIKNFASREPIIQMPSAQLGSSIAVDTQVAIIVSGLIEEKGDTEKTINRLLININEEKRKELEGKRTELKNMIDRTKENIIPMLLSLGILQE